MLTPELFWSAQARLLADPGYVGVTAGSTVGGLTLHWIAEARPGPAAAEAIAQLQAAGVRVEQQTASATAQEVVDERDRLIWTKPGNIPVYTSGTNVEDTRVDITVAIGSFAEAQRRGSDLLTDLASRAPIAVRENDRPIPL